MWLRLGSSLAAVAVLAGCCSIPFSVSQVPPDAPSAGGVWERKLTFQVLGPDEPADDVPLFVFWKDPKAANRLVLLGLRSDAGRAEAHVPGGVAVHVSAGGGAWTEEWLPDTVAAGPGAATATVRVYPAKVAGAFNGTWQAGAASAWQDARQGDVAWMLEDVTPGQSAGTRAGFAERLAGLRATVAWENTLTEQADLGVGAWHRSPEATRCTFHDAGNELASLGAKSEAYDSATDGYDSGARCGSAMSVGGKAPPAGAILLGPGTGRPALMPLGVDYQVRYELAFGQPVGIEELCGRLGGSYELHYVDPETGVVTRTGKTATYASPAPLAPLIALGLLGLAFVVRRLRA